MNIAGACYLITVWAAGKSVCQELYQGSSRPRDIFQIRAGREQVVLTGEGVLHVAELGKDWQAMADCTP